MESLAYISASDVPDALASLSDVADAGFGALFIYRDNIIVGSNKAGMALYPRFNWGSEISFDDCFWYGLAIGRTRNAEILKDPQDHLNFAKLHRSWSPGHRFCRRHADTNIIYDRHHIGIDQRWNAQVWLPVTAGSAVDFAVTPLTRPFDVRRHLAREQALSRLVAYLEGSGTALAIVDGTGIIADSTPAMTRLLCRGALLRLSPADRVESPSPEITQRLQSAISDISSGRRPAALVPLPLEAGGHTLVGLLRAGPNDPAVILAIAGTDEAEELEGLLCDAFQLSPPEAAVAIRVADGATAEVIAESTDRSVATIRNHLTSVKRKTGAERQHSLAALVTRAAALVGGSSNSGDGHGASGC